MLQIGHTTHLLTVFDFSFDRRSVMPVLHFCGRRFLAHRDDTLRGTGMIEVLDLTPPWHHQESTSRREEPLHFSTVFRPRTFPETAHFAGLFGGTLQRIGAGRQHAIDTVGLIVGQQWFPLFSESGARDTTSPSPLRILPWARSLAASRLPGQRLDDRS